jgi:Lamin Tail Domain/PEP-CTERM motif
MHTNLLRAAALSALLSATTAQAQLAFTEAAPWSSGNSPVAADWFEITNFGAEAVDISGWKVDDGSNSFASSVALVGVTSVAPGESVVFIEGAAANTQFANVWFGGTLPSGLQVGRYSGSGIGLSTSGDALNLFKADGSLVTRLDLGASPTSVPLASFDNGAGLSGITLATLSVVGVNGAFLAAAGGEIGSPGTVGAVPEPGTLALWLAGAGVVAGVARRRRA